MLYATGFLLTVITQMLDVTWEASLPAVLPDDALLPTNAGMSAVSSFARLVGPAMAGALLVTLGPGAVFRLDGVSFLALLAPIVVLVGQMRRHPAPPEPLGDRDWWRDITAGVRHIWGDPILRALSGVYVALGAGVQLGETLVLWYYRHTHDASGCDRHGPGAEHRRGGGIGGSLVAGYARRLGAGLAIVVGIYVAASGFGIMAVAPTSAGAIVGSVLLSLPEGAIIPLVTTFKQQRTPVDVLENW